MKALLAALAVAKALVVAGGLPAATGPSLTVVRSDPYTIAGRGFAPREHVAVTLYGGRRWTSRVVAGPTGRFTARLVASQPRCSAWVVRAAGSRGHRASHSGATGACDPAVSAGTAPPDGAVGIAGVVRRGPIAPACVSGQPCTAPVAGVAVDLLQGDVALAHVVTGADGRYYVVAAPGVYTVRIAGRGLRDKAARVKATHFAEVDFLIDTRIR